MRHDEEVDRPDLSAALLRRVFSYGRPYRGWIALVLTTIIVSAVLAVIPAILMRELLDVAIPTQDIGLLTLLGIAMIAVPLLNVGVGGVQGWAASRAGEGIIFDLRRQLFEHLQGMSLRFFTATRTGEIMARLSNDVIGAQRAVTGTFVTIASNVLSAAAILIVIFRTEWRLSLLALAALPIFIVAARRVARVLRRVTERQMEHNAEMSAVLSETLNVSGALHVKLFGRAPHEAKRFSDEAAHVRDLGVLRSVIGRWFFAGLGLISAFATALVFWVGGLLVINGEMTVGTIVMLSTLVVQLFSPLSGLSNARVEFATALVSFERVFEVLDLPQEIAEKPDAVSLAQIEGAVAFRNVSFKYQTDGRAGLQQVKRFSRSAYERAGGVPQQTSPSRTMALSDLSFRIERGELVALVGPSGAGKTTVSYLVPRLYDVVEGAVEIDGHDIRDLTLDSLSRGIGIVTQEAYLFHDSIASNLRYAHPEATLEELEAACRTANIHDFIESLPAGYDTVVGERGYRLSGGEKQRVALARVILKDPSILILDEATSHLDAKSEALIQSALDRVMAGRTSLVIAHRLSTILAADRILVLDQGRLAEEGTHQDLIGANGLYAALYETQFQPAAV
ncbi:MAG: ABC transporter ATP-binding protein [Acidimicrobiia bacterium]